MFALFRSRFTKPTASVSKETKTQIPKNNESEKEYDISFFRYYVSTTYPVVGSIRPSKNVQVLKA